MKKTILQFFLVAIFLNLNCLAQVKVDCNDLRRQVNETCPQPNEKTIITVQSYIEKCKPDEIVSFKKMVQFRKDALEKKKNTSCFDKFSSDNNITCNLNKSKIDGEDLEKEQPELEESFKSSKAPLEQQFIKGTSNVDFFASKHTLPSMASPEAISYNTNVLNNLAAKKMNSLIVEKSEDELNTPWLACHFTKSKSDILNRESEREVAIWYAIHNNIPLVGGEPAPTDFNTFFEQKNIGITALEHRYYNLFICFSNQRNETIKKSGQINITIDEAFEKCSQDNKGITGAAVTLDGFKTWFDKKSPSGFDYRNREKCVGTNGITFTQIFSDPCIEFTPWPNSKAPVYSLAYIENARNKLKNYCLRNAIANETKDGNKNISVIYGGGHLFENFSALSETQNDCESKNTTPKTGVKDSGSEATSVTPD